MRVPHRWGTRVRMAGGGIDWLSPKATKTQDVVARFEPYGQMMSQIVHSIHRSCLVLISREHPQGFDTQEMANGDVAPCTYKA